MVETTGPSDKDKESELKFISEGIVVKITGPKSDKDKKSQS